MKEKGHLTFYSVEQEELQCVLAIQEESQIENRKAEKKRKTRVEEKTREGKEGGKKGSNTDRRGLNGNLE